MDEKQYLQEDFDPKSLKVAQLRGILNEYDISFPSNAKKTDLIKLFNDEIKPNASKYLKEYEKSIKNSNDVGFINATTGKTVRRSKRSTSADVELNDSEKEKKSKGAKISEQASDISGLESDTEATNEAKKTRKKTKDSKKTKKSSKEEITEKVGASSDASEIESGAKQTSRIKDDEKSDVKGTINSAIKSESSFTNENVFQSPPSSAGIKKTRSPSNYKSPSTSKKRHRENDENQEGSPDTTKKAKVPSSKSPKPSSDTRLKSTPHKTGHLFDDNESSDSDTDIFSKSIINQVKSPKLSKIKKPSSKKSTPVKVEKQTPVKKSTPGDINALYQNITPSSRTRESQHVLSAKSSSKKTNSIKNSAKKNNSAISDSTFLSLSDEQDDFDKEQSKIKSRGKSSTHETPSGVDILASTDLASQLGITIQGLPPKDFQLSDNSFASIKSHTPTKKLSPRPRKHKSQKISQTDLDKLSDDDDEDEDDYEEEEKSGKKFDKIQKGIEEEIEKLNDVVEKENSVSIRKPSALNILSFISLWLIILSVGLSGYWYREQTYLIGYCGQEINQSTIPQSSDLPNWLVQFGTYLDNNFKPNCVKCPAHARCYPYLEIGCYEDFVEYKPWYFDFIPIINPSLKKCVPDTKKAEKLEIMIDVALDLLRSKNANKNCGKTAVDNFESGLSVDELHDLLLLMKAPYITKEEFEELWQRSVIELEKEPEIITGLRVGDIFSTVDSNNTRKEEKENKVFRSTSLSNLSLKCQLQNTMIKSMMEYKSIIAACLGMIIAGILLKYRYEQFKLERLKIETIYNEVLRKLRKQYKVSKSTNYKVPSYIGSTQLRDLILTNETNLTRKLTLWNKVSHKVENNSNIRYHLIENHGEIMKVWEWITDMEIHD